MKFPPVLRRRRPRDPNSPEDGTMNLPGSTAFALSADSDDSQRSCHCPSAKEEGSFDNSLMMPVLDSECYTIPFKNALVSKDDILSTIANMNETEEDAYSPSKKYLHRPAHLFNTTVDEKCRAKMLDWSFKVRTVNSTCLLTKFTYHTNVSC